MNVFELEASLKLNTKDYEKNLKSAQSSAKDISKDMDKLEDAAEDMAEAFGDAASDIEDSFSDVDRAISGASFDVAIEGTDDMTGAFSDLADGAAESAGEVNDSLVSMGDGVGVVGDIFTQGFGAIPGIIAASGAGAAIAGVVTAIAGIGTTMIDAAREYEQGSDNIILATGYIGDEADELTRKFHEAYLESKNLNGSWDEYSSAAGQAATLWEGDLGKDGVVAMMQEIDSFANVTSSNLYADVEDLNRMLGAWHMDASELTGIMSIMHQATVDGVSDVGELMSVLSGSASMFSDYGVGLEDATEWLVQYNALGGDMSNITRLMATGLSNIEAAGYSGDGMLQKMTDTMAACSSTEEALNATIEGTDLTIKDVFGDNARSRDMINFLIDGQGAFEDLGYEMDQSTEKIHTLEDAQTDAADEAKIAARNAKENMSELADETINSIAGLYENTKNLGENFLKTAEDTQDKVSNVFLDGMVANHQITKQGAEDIINTVNSAISEVGSKNIKIGNSVTIPNVQATVSSILGNAFPTFTASAKTQYYARGYHEAMLLTSPTIFGVNGGSAMVGGDGAGGEIVSGEAHLRDMIAEVFNQSLGGVSSLLAQYLPVLADGQAVYLDGEKVSKNVSRRIGRDVERRLNG